MDSRVKKLCELKEKHFRRWTETFVDDETGKEETRERCELVNDYVTDEELRLAQEVVTDVPNLSDGDLLEYDDALQLLYDLSQMCESAVECFRTSQLERIHRGLTRMGYDPDYCGINWLIFDEGTLLDLYNQGHEDAVEYFCDERILQGLCDKGSKKAAARLMELYLGDYESDGYFRNREKAKHYYDLAGDCADGEWQWDDDPCAEYPEDEEDRYVLTGDAATLDGIEKLIDTLCERYGMPGNELGLYIPLPRLMKELVDTDAEYYGGNVLGMERETPERFVIVAEVCDHKHLLYALRYRYPGLDVQVRRYNWGH